MRSASSVRSIVLVAVIPDESITLSRSIRFLPLAEAITRHSVKWNFIFSNRTSRYLHMHILKFQRLARAGIARSLKVETFSEIYSKLKKTFYYPQLCG